jgi:surface protein
MEGMFFNAAAFNQDISNWDVGSVTNMEGMFQNAAAFNQDISNWDVGSVTRMKNMFDGVTLSTTNYDNLLIAWALQELQSNITFSGGNSKYCAGASARESMTINYDWTITDGGQRQGEINLQGNGIDIISGSTSPSASNNTDFGSLLVNNPSTKTYTMQNLGTGVLTISSISISGTNAANFAIGGIDLSTPLSIAASASSTFSVIFDAATSGTKTATVSINTDDCDAGVYTFAVTASAQSVDAPTASAQSFGPGATVGSLVATGTALQWYSAPTGGSALNTSDVLETNTYYVSQTVDGVESDRTAVAVTILSGSICGNIIDNVFTLKLPSGGTTISDLNSSVNGNILTLTVANSQNSLVLSSNATGISTDGTATYTIDLSQFSTFAGLSVEGNLGIDLVTIGAGGLDFSALPGSDNQLITINLSDAADKLTVSHTIKSKGTGDIYDTIGRGICCCLDVGYNGQYRYLHPD